MKISELFLQLEETIGAQISIELVNYLFHTSQRLMIPAAMTIHNHKFCRYIKSLDSNTSCAINKHRTIKMAYCGHRFCGICPHGLWELVQPVMFQKKLAAVLYFGPFIDVSKTLDGTVLADYGNEVLPPTINEEKKQMVKDYAAFFARFISFELEVAQRESITDEKKHDADYYCSIVNNMIALQYMDNITLGDVANACHINANYLSNLLKKRTGKTFSQMLTEQRITEAEILLKYHTSMTIGEIAAACGFRDSNYFCLVFHRITGNSPTDFRNNWRIDLRLARL